MSTPTGKPPPWRRNGAILVALGALLAASYHVAFLKLGVAGTALGIAIAFVKAGLVVSLFMELDRANTLVRLAAASGCIFAAVLFALTFSDVLTRP